MSDEMVPRLKAFSVGEPYPVELYQEACRDAADEIERLKAENLRSGYVSVTRDAYDALLDERDDHADALVVERARSDSLAGENAALREALGKIVRRCQFVADGVTDAQTAVTWVNSDARSVLAFREHKEDEKNG